MKAIFINSKLKVFYEIDLSSNSDNRMAEMHDRLECNIFTTGASYPNGDILFVDDEGLLSLTDKSMFFKLDDFEFLAGNGILIGPETEFDDGAWTVEDVQTSIKDIKVNFLTRNQLRSIL